MPKENVIALAREPVTYRARSNGPYIPATDNEPGAPETLLKANRVLRERHGQHPTIARGTRCSSATPVTWRTSPSKSVHLVVTSPPYFNLKALRVQFGRAATWPNWRLRCFSQRIGSVWRECERVLVPGGRICCVIGDILIPRRGTVDTASCRCQPISRFAVRKIGLDNLTPILWFKIGNRHVEAGGDRAVYYGKPYQPGADH